MSEPRPAIPAELKRAVLVEAGHRCAILTCRATTTEIAHIVPWHDVREHNFDNLIALCPNCHTRYDKGEIDGKAMIMYKARLGAMNERFHSSLLEHGITPGLELDIQEAGSVAEVISKIEAGNLGLWDPNVKQTFFPEILALSLNPPVN